MRITSCKLQPEVTVAVIENQILKLPHFTMRIKRESSFVDWPVRLLTSFSGSHMIYCTHVLIHTVHTPGDCPGTVEYFISETDSSEGSDLSSSPEDNDTDTINTPTLR